MIIKYYDEGWNYIDEAEDIKWINKRYDNLMEAFYKRNPNGEDFDSNLSSETRRKQYLINQMEYEFGSTDFEYPGYLKYGISMEFIENNMYFENNKIDKKHPTPNPYLRIIFYTKNDIRKVIVFTKAGYLLNNNGKTVEKIG